MRNGMTSQLSFYRSSDYYILLEDLAKDGGAMFQRKKANKLASGMYPAYYPEEITRKEAPSKKRKVSGSAGLGAGPGGTQGHRRPQQAALQEDPGAVLEKLARREAQGLPQDVDLEEEMEELDENEGDALDEGWESDPYENYDDDDGYDEEDNEGNENIY